MLWGKDFRARQPALFGMVSQTLAHRSAIQQARSLLPQVLGHSFAAGMDVELAVDALDMRPNGVDADRERRSYFLVWNAPRKMVQNFPLPVRELLHIRAEVPPPIEILNDFAGDVPCHGRVAAMDIGNHVQNLRLRCPLQQVAAGARQQGVENLVAVLIDSQHEDLCGRNQPLELADTLDRSEEH